MKKPPILVVVLLVLSQMSFPAPSGACGFRQSLWDAIEQGDLIVVARIASVQANPADDDPDSETFAGRETVVLEILDTWKGPRLSEARVDFDSGAPSGQAVGEVVVEFLERGETRARRWREMQIATEADIAEPSDDPQDGDEAETTWTPEERAEAWALIERFTERSAGHWLSVFASGELRSVEDEDRDALKELVERAVRMQAGGSQDFERLDWFVSAAESRATRQYGLYDLEPGALTHEQLGRLASGLRRQPTVDQMDVDLLKILAAYPGLEVDRAAASVVEAGLLLEPIPAWVVGMVAETLKRYGDDFAERIGRDDVDTRGRPIYTGPGQNTLPTIWEVARRELGIPEVSPAETPVRRLRSSSGGARD